jgi:hypothetical protein
LCLSATAIMTAVGPAAGGDRGNCRRGAATEHAKDLCRVLERSDEPVSLWIG